MLLGPTQGNLGRRNKNIRDNVSTTGDGTLARLAVPDTSRVSTDGDLAAESAGVLGVLSDFHLLHLLSQGSTVANGTAMLVEFPCRTRA